MNLFLTGSCYLYHDIFWNLSQFLRRDDFHRRPARSFLNLLNHCSTDTYQFIYYSCRYQKSYSVREIFYSSYELTWSIFYWTQGSPNYKSLLVFRHILSGSAELDILVSLKSFYNWLISITHYICILVTDYKDGLGIDFIFRRFISTMSRWTSITISGYLTVFAVLWIHFFFRTMFPICSRFLKIQNEIVQIYNIFRRLLRGRFLDFYNAFR